MNRNMKTGILLLLVMSTLVLCLAGCAGKRATAVVTFDSFDNGQIVGAAPKAGSAAGLDLNVLTVNVTQEGVYPFVIRANDTEYTFILTYENGKFSAEADEGLTFSIK